MRKDVVVIGAGINGLVAAHYLRRAGFGVTLIERAQRVGGACISEVATVEGHAQKYALGASVLGLMQGFIFQETGLADRLQTYVPALAKRVHYPDANTSAWIHRDPAQLQRELADKWGARGDAGIHVRGATGPADVQWAVSLGAGSVVMQELNHDG